MSKSKTEAVRPLMTAEECEAINKTSRDFLADREKRRQQATASQQAEAHRANQMRCVWWIGWAAFGWTVAFAVALMAAHTHRLPLDMILSLICGASIIAGIVIGRLIGKMGE